MQIITDLTELINAATIGFSLVQTAAATAQGSSVNLGNGCIDTAAIVGIGTVTGTVTTGVVQIEQWDGTTNTTWTVISNMVATAFTAATTQVLLGLRTYSFVRANLVTLTSTTTVSFTISVAIMDMPKSSGQATGFSNVPQNTTTQ